MSVQVLVSFINAYISTAHNYIQPGNSVPTSGNTFNMHGSSLLTARNLQDLGSLNNSVRENSENTSNLSQASDLNIAPTALHIDSSDEPEIEDPARWIAWLTYICPSLQSFVADSGLEEIDSFEHSDVDFEELVTELVEDIADTVQQLYDLGPSLAWEVTLPKTEHGSEGERQSHMEGEESMEEGAVHYLRLTQDKFSHISNRLALRLAKANWMRFQRLETARKAGEAERILLASRKIRGESHADSGYYTGSKSGTLQGQDDNTRLKDESNTLSNIGTEYGSNYSSMDGFGAHGRLRFPAPPMPQSKLDDGKVDCTVCGSTVGPFRNKREWRQVNFPLNCIAYKRKYLQPFRLHVVRDLAPYVCPLLECDSKQIVFDSQRSFTTHLRRHLDLPTSWRCQFPQCNILFNRLGPFQEHIQSSHGISEGEDTKHICDTWVESTGINFEETPCPICNNTMNASVVQRSKHFGHHMIELALLSIPNHSLDLDVSEDSHSSRLSDASKLSFRFHEFGSEDTNDASEAELAQKSMLEEDESIINEKINVERPDRPTSSISREHSVMKVNQSEGSISQVFRPVSKEEAWALHIFESHAQKCIYCHNPEEVHRKHELLCERGHELAQDVCAFLYNHTDGKTYSTTEEDGKRVLVEIPNGYDESKSLLIAVERSLRLSHELPFVSMDESDRVAPMTTLGIGNVQLETPSGVKRPRTRKMVIFGHRAQN